MKHLTISIRLLGLLTVVAAYASAADKPNVIFILADDMGYSDLGCYGSDIETPNLNGLAENGLKFTQFYNMAAAGRREPPL